MIVDVRSAIVLSLLVATAATALAIIPATYLGWLLSRVLFRGKTLLKSVILLPLVFPPVVTGLLLLIAFGRSSAIGGWLNDRGFGLPFTTAAAVLAAAVVGFPLLVGAAAAAFDAVDPRYEQLSRSLGMNRRRTFARVTLPLAGPGILAGAVLAFARALGEFGATVVFAGNIEGETRTIALAVYSLLDVPARDAAMHQLLAASISLSVIAVVIHEILLARHRRRLELPRV